MTTKLILRCLDADGALLGWTQVDAAVRGDGKLWSPGPVIVTPMQSGICAVLSVHWCDVNVEVRQACSETLVAGVPSILHAQSAPLITVGPMPGALPPVTVGSVVVSPDSGTLGVKAT